jgi:tetratricopeptide (TPR) repeat protein
VQRSGGIVRDSVTRGTSFLVAGEGDSPGAALASRKLRAAERLNAEGGYVRIVDESEFLRLAGIAPAGELGERYYTASDIEALYHLDRAALRQLDRLRLVRPVLRTNADRYYTFHDLLVLRQVHEAMAGGAPSADRALAHRAPGAAASGLGPPLVIELRRPEEDAWSAEDWYVVGCESDEAPGDLTRATLACSGPRARSSSRGRPRRLGNVYYRLAGRRCPPPTSALSPRPAGSHALHLGNVYDDLEEYRTAIRFFESALRLRASNADAHFNLGLVHDRLGNVERVRFHMQAYLGLEPEGELAEVAREYLSLTAAEDGAPA